MTNSNSANNARAETLKKAARSITPLILPAFALCAFGCCPDPASGASPDGAAAPAAPRSDYPLGVIGETEAVYLPGFSAPFEARIDTGATTSSIDAKNIRNFERDGKKWVSFEIRSRADGQVKNYELPVERTVPIKRHGAPDQMRYSVILTFRMGHMTMDREFTLTDRGGFEYPVLIGRNVISGTAMVDPSRHNIL